MSEDRQKGQIGRDSLNLVEFPISFLGDQVPKDLEVLVRKDFVQDPNNPDLMRPRTLTIKGSSGEGFPNSTDEDVVLALIQISRAWNDFQDRQVYFTIKEVLEILRWKADGKSYQRIMQAIDRWKGIKLTYEGSWYERGSKIPVTRALGIISNYEIFHIKGKIRTGDTSNMSWFRWDDIFLESLKSGYLKEIDLDLYFSLKSKVARRIYRYVSKYFWRDPVLRRDLETFAYEKVGIARRPDLGQAKSKLSDALKELEDVGFLAATDDNVRYQKVSPGKWLIFLYEAGSRPEATRTQTVSIGVVGQLTALGITEQVASDLVAAHGDEQCLRQIKWLPARNKVKNPAAYLVSAIDGDYSPPAVVTKTKDIGVVVQTTVSAEQQQTASKTRDIAELLSRLTQQELDDAEAEAIEKADEAARDLLSNPAMAKLARMSLRNKLLLEKHRGLN